MTRFAAACLVLAGLSAGLLAGAVPARADCKDDVIAILDRSLLAGPYRTQAAITAGSRQITVASTIVPPADIRSRTTVDGKTREIVKIGDRAWVDQDGQGFREAPPAAAVQIGQMIETQRRIEPSLINDVDCKGRQTVDGRDLLVFAYKIDLPGGKASSSSTLYVDAGSRLPTRVVVDGRAGSVMSRTEMSYVFDAALKIEPPPAAAAPAAPAPAAPQQP
jgi:hypothetical protein